MNKTYFSPNSLFHFSSSSQGLVAVWWPHATPIPQAARCIANFRCGLKHLRQGKTCQGKRKEYIHMANLYVDDKNITLCNPVYIHWWFLTPNLSVCYKLTISQTVANLMEKTCRQLQQGREHGTSMAPQIDAIILLDRPVDFSHSSCTQLTYEGLIDKVYGIKYSEETDRPTQMKEKEIDTCTKTNNNKQQTHQSKTVFWRSVRVLLSDSYCVQYKTQSYKEDKTETFQTARCFG